MELVIISNTLVFEYQKEDAFVTEDIFDYMIVEGNRNACAMVTDGIVAIDDLSALYNCHIMTRFSFFC